jgi:hypothetical protein
MSRERKAARGARVVLTGADDTSIVLSKVFEA